MRKDDPSGALDNVIEAPMAQRQMAVSESLRLRRIECGLDILHVAEVLRIRPAVLTAIEDGNFHLLPGPAYAIGFVRSYATYLGLDAESLVQRFKAEAAEVSHRPHLHFPLPIRDSRVPTGPLLIICVMLAVATYAGWYYFNGRPAQPGEMAPSVPDRLHHLFEPPVVHAPAPAESAKTDTAGAEPTASAQGPTTKPSAGGIPAQVANLPATTNPAPPAAVDGVPPIESTPPVLPPALPATASDLAQPATVAADAAPMPATAYGAPEGQARVVLKANAESWVQVRDKGSTLLFTRVLKPGEHYNVPNVPGLTLVAGNAGGLDVTVDGMSAPHLGEPGRVVRNVSLDPDHLLGGRPHAN